MRASVFEIKRFAVHDGDGIRTTVFLKGCPLKCVWCHNPEGISAKPMLAYFAHKCIGCGECVNSCLQNAHKMGENGHIFKRESCIGCGASKKRTPNADGILGTVIISEGEHPSIDNPAKRLADQGYALVRVPTKGGVLDLGFLKTALENAKANAAPVIFAAFMLVNNETGAIYDVKAASSLVKRYFPDAVVHCDAVQGYMKLRFTPATLGADTLSVSAHKIHAPRGAAALYISGEVIKRKNIVPVMPGGGQEDGFRSGTENLLGIAAFAAAADYGYTNAETHRKTVADLRAYLNERLAELAESGVAQNKPEKQLDNIASIVIPGVRSETMLNHLSAREVYVSAGSACSAHSKKKSDALTAFGVEDDRIDSTIRVSLSYTNTKDDIDALIEGLRTGSADLQKK